MTARVLLSLRKAPCRLFALVAVLATGIALASPAGATRFPRNGLRFFVDLGVRPVTGSSLDVETIKGSLRRLSLRATRDVKVAIPSGAAGRRIGRLDIAGGPYALTLPRSAGSTRHPDRDIVLLDGPGSLQVVLRPNGGVGSFTGGPVVLSVSGIAVGVRSVAISFDGLGRGILGVPHGCPVQPTMMLYALRYGAAPVLASSGVRC